MEQDSATDDSLDNCDGTLAGKLLNFSIHMLSNVLQGPLPGEDSRI